jgi:ATP-dependent RNA helicase DDX56/DBP9
MNYILDNEKTWVARDFGLDRRLIKALSKQNFIYPTLVQSKCIPIAIQGKDVLVRARTGSGKTLAFGLPLLHKLLVSKSLEERQWNTSNAVFSVILAPTKELCKQIEKNMTEIMYYCKDLISIASLVNDDTGTPMRKITADIVVSTPARVVKYINAELINISATRILVIDEADLILSFGYAEDVQVITSHLPKIVQGLLMSATLSPALEKFKRIVLNNPAILKLEEPINSGKLLQFYLMATPQDKYLILYVFLKLGLLQGKGLIFVNDVNKCYRLKLVLQQFFINAAVLNSEMPLNSRLHIIEVS